MPASTATPLPQVPQDWQEPKTPAGSAELAARRPTAHLPPEAVVHAVGAPADVTIDDAVTISSREVQKMKVRECCFSRSRLACQHLVFGLSA